MFSAAPATKVPLAFVRTSPVQSQFDPATPQWARGMLVTQTLGPFAQANGEPAWVDLIALTKGIPYQFTTAAAPFAILPIAHSPTGRPNASHIGPGSVWISGKLLTPGAPVNSWVGFRIKAGGTLAAARLLINPDNIGVQGIACTLTADLDPPPAPPVVTGPGVDASRAQVDLPASIQIEFTPTSATIKLLSPFGLTVYDQRVNVTWNGGAPFYNDPAKEIFVPGDVDLGPGGNFTFGPAGSAVFQPSGKSPVATAAWGLQVAITTPDKLGEAAGAGGIAVSVGPVISGTWKQSAKAVSFSSLTLQAAPGQIGLMAVLAAPEQQTFQLWDEAPLPNGKVRASTLDFAAPAGTPLFFATAVINGQGSEQMTIGGTVAAHTDRPVGVDGLRLPYSGAALLSIFENSTGIFLVVQAAGKITDRLIAIALENALVRVFSPQFLFVFGKLGDTRVDQGALVFFFHIEQLLPILPDPYAASFKSPLHTPGNLQSLVTWLAPETPELSFSLQVDPKTQLPSDGNNLAFISRAHYNLVDVSSNVDQLGVSWVPKVPADIVAQKLAIAAQGDVVSLFTVSEISWEPMDSKDPIPTPPTDGIPSRVTVPTVKLTPVEPLPLLNAQLASVKGGAAVLIDTALPFGLTASIGNKTGNTVSRFDLNQPDFDTDAAALGGGLQLTHCAEEFCCGKPSFPGSTFVTGPYGPRGI